MARDLTGNRFGRYLVLGERSSSKTPGGWYIVTWLVRCDCGNERRVQQSNLLSGSNQSCGCLKSELTRSRMQKAPGTAATNQVLSYYTRNAQRRGLYWELSREAFVELIFGKCNYCGFSDSMRSIKGHDMVLHNGIDRLDSRQGYSATNCVTACKICNQAKSTMSVEEFRAWVLRVAKWAQQS